jgi:hypothetical protein
MFCRDLRCHRARLSYRMDQTQPGDELQCPHCRQWHVVDRPYADHSTAESAHLYVTCPLTKGRYFVGAVGSKSRWPWRGKATAVPQNAAFSR